MQLHTPSQTRYRLLLAGTRAFASPVGEAYLRWSEVRKGGINDVQVCDPLTGGRSRLEMEVGVPSGARAISDGTRSAPMPIARYVDGRGAPVRRWPSIHVWEAERATRAGPGDDPREARDPDQRHPARDAGGHSGGRPA